MTSLMSKLSGFASLPAPRPSDAADRVQARAAALAAERKADAEGIRAKGLVKWAQEKKLEALREKVMKEIMKERGLREKDISTLSGADRKTLDEEIAKRIQEQVVQAMEKEIGEAAQQGRPARPMIVDLSV